MKTIEAYILLRKGTGNLPVILHGNTVQKLRVALEKIGLTPYHTERVVPCTITIDPKYLEKESDDK